MGNHSTNFKKKKKTEETWHIDEKLQLKEKSFQLPYLIDQSDNHDYASLYWIKETKKNPFETISPKYKKVCKFPTL